MLNVPVVAFIQVKKKLLYQDEAKKKSYRQKSSDLKHAVTDLSIKKAATKYGVSEKKNIGEKT